MEEEELLFGFNRRSSLGSIDIIVYYTVIAPGSEPTTTSASSTGRDRLGE